MKVLVTGGAGYIGSHTCKLLAAAGHQPVVFDDLSTGHEFLVRYGPLVRGDIADPHALRGALVEHRPDAVIHFAASAYVGESARRPRLYYRNNVVGTLNLLDAMAETGASKLVFSSSCATYGAPATTPIDEGAPQEPINNYGHTKLVGERMLRAAAEADGLACIALRYFNACGADPAGDLGEVHDPETHAIPLLLQATAGVRPSFSIFGDDYPTPDGTCVRDYLHVADLARAHLRALERLPRSGGFDAVNLGTGRGWSVRELVDAARRVTGRSPAVTVEPRRPGDPPILVAATGKAERVLGWSAELSDLDTIMSTAWAWMRSPCNPARIAFGDAT